MKILHVTPAYLPAYRYGGPIETVHALNKYLVRAGADVTVYTTAANGAKDLEVPLGAPVDRDGVKVHYFRPALLRSWFYSPELAAALRAHAGEFDLVHITSVFLAASTLGARAARRAGVPYVISPRGALMRVPLAARSPWKKKWYLRTVEKGNLEHAGAVHFTVDAEREEYAALGYRVRKQLVIPNGLDTETLEADVPPGSFRAKLGIPAHAPLVLFLGRVNWKKGLDTLIPAFAEAARSSPDAFLVVAGGDDGYRSEAERLIARCGIGARTRFADIPSREERVRAYRDADVFALASYSENFAITVAEAMYFGIPVVVTEGVGSAAWVRRAAAGLVVPKRTAEFAAALGALLRDPVAAKEMGRRGRAAARSEFSYERVAARFLEAYNEIISSHRAA